MSQPEPAPSRTEAVLLAGVYVVPLTVCVGVLAYAGLPGLALALLAVEALVSAMVVTARRPEGAGRSGAAVALVAVAVVAGAAAAALLVQSAPGG